jgi:hypothetical protein
MLMKRAIAIALLPAIVVSSSGCSFLASSSQPVVVVPSHPSAQIFVDGILQGTGTQTVNLSKKSIHSVMAKCGDSSGVATIDRTLSTTGILDIVGGIVFLIPFLGLLAPGAWELSPTTISVPIPDTSACGKANC